MIGESFAVLRKDKKLVLFPILSGLSTLAVAAMYILPLFRMGLGVDLLVYTPEEYERLKAEGHPLIERVEREGITVYARSESRGSEVARAG